MVVEPSGSSSVTGAIRQAARATGTDFKYLLATAQVESSLNPNAQVSTSSARGLFQFIEQTWLMTLKEQGPALGYAPYAGAITRLPSGQYAVSDPRMHDAVMKLRLDPTANALMAGAFTRANAGRLAERLGRSPTEGELYIAHFLGAAGAGRLISVADAAPRTPAASLFPGPARANPSVFYDGRGHARSAVEVYRILVGRYDLARGSPPSTPTMVAPAAEAAAPRREPPPSPAQTVQAYAAAASPLRPAAHDTGPVFHGLFRTGATDQAVAPLVSALWTAPLPAPAEPPPAKAAAVAPKPQPKPTPLPEPSAAPRPAEKGEIGLFQEHLPDARALFRGRV
jgi:hypothetical protein